MESQDEPGGRQREKGEVFHPSPCLCIPNNDELGFSSWFSLFLSACLSLYLSGSFSLCLYWRDKHSPFTPGGLEASFRYDAVQSCFLCHKTDLESQTDLQTPSGCHGCVSQWSVMRETNCRELRDSSEDRWQSYTVASRVDQTSEISGPNPSPLQNFVFHDLFTPANPPF